jgi:hypothetical protein
MVVQYRVGAPLGGRPDFKGMQQDSVLGTAPVFVFSGRIFSSGGE